MTLGSPRDPTNYIKIKDESMIEFLHASGFIPLYRDLDSMGVYFKKTVELLNFMKGD